MMLHGDWMPADDSVNHLEVCSTNTADVFAMRSTHMMPAEVDMPGGDMLLAVPHQTMLMVTGKQLIALAQSVTAGRIGGLIK